MKKVILICTVISVLHCMNLNAQKPAKNKGVFKEYAPGYFKNKILKGIEEFENKDEAKKA